MTIIGIIFDFSNKERGEFDTVQFHLKFDGHIYTAVKGAENKINMMTKPTIKNNKTEYYCDEQIRLKGIEQSRRRKNSVEQHMMRKNVEYILFFVFTYIA